MERLSTQLADKDVHVSRKGRDRGIHLVQGPSLCAPEQEEQEGEHRCHEKQLDGDTEVDGLRCCVGAALGFVVDDVPDRSNDKGKTRKKSEPLALKDQASEQKKKPSAAPKRVKKHQIKQEREEEEEVKDEEKITKEIRKKCLAQSSKLSKLVPKLFSFFSNNFHCIVCSSLRRTGSSSRI